VTHHDPRAVVVTDPLQEAMVRLRPLPLVLPRDLLSDQALAWMREQAFMRERGGLRGR
jgi:hypothetical protein